MMFSYIFIIMPKKINDIDIIELNLIYYCNNVRVRYYIATLNYNYLY